jgi:hypothetical protein
MMNWKMIGFRLSTRETEAKFKLFVTVFECEGFQQRKMPPQMAVAVV